MIEMIIFLVLFFSAILQFLLLKDLFVSIPLILVQLSMLIILWIRMKKHRENNNRNEVHKVENNDLCNKKILQVMSIYRHDWQNHMQIILGYIQLKKYDQISKYIYKISQMAISRSIISNISYSNLAVFLYALPINYPLLSQEIEILPGIEKKINNDLGELIHRTLQRLIDTIYQEIPSNQEHHLILSLGSLEEKIMITIEFEGDIMNAREDILLLQNDLKNENGDLIIDIENKDEFVMEINFPITN